MADNTQSFVRDPPITGASFTPTLKLQSQIPGAIPNQPISTFAFNPADTIFTGDTIFTNPICAKEIRLKENLSTNIQDATTNYLALKAPDILTANTTWTLPPSDGTAGQLINTDGSGNLGFATDAGGDIKSALNFTDDNRVTRTDTISGVKNIQQSSVTLDDLGNYSGVQSHSLLIDGLENTKYGFNALNSVTTANFSVAIGSQALEGATTIFGGVAIGYQAMQNCNRIGCIGIGYQAVKEATQPFNIGIGTQALLSTLGGFDNIGLGGNALRGNLTGNGHTAVGHNALNDNTIGQWNVAIGNNTIRTNTTGDHNVVVGGLAASTNPTWTGSDNIILGYLRGINLTTTDSNNILIDSDGIAADNQTIRLGNAQTSCFIKGIHNQTPAAATQNVVIDSNGQLGSTTVLNSTQSSTLFIATEDDDEAVLIDCDAAGFADIKALDIIYKSGALNTGDFNIASLVLLDESLTTGGRLFGNAVLSTDLGLAETHALGVGSTVHPIYHQSGGYANADTILVNAVDEKTNLSSGGAGNISVFVADNDTITVGSSAKYSQMQIGLDTGSSGAGVAPTFEYSTGVGTWAFFSPTDGTNAFRNTGIISWDTNDIPGWLIGLASEFLIRITRTRNTLSVTPILDLIQITAVTLYGWDKNGDVTVNSVNVKECNLIETGGGTDIITLQAPASISGYTLTLPVDDGNASEVLTTDGSGVLTWTVSSSGLPTGYITGLGMSNGTTTDTDKDIAVGRCRSDDDTFDIVIGSILTVDNTVSGANGLDTGSVTANTWYTIWVIDDASASAPAGLMSLSEFSPTLPGSFDVKRRVGWARTDGSSDFYKAFYGKAGFARGVLWDESETILEVLTDGSATVYTVVDCSEWIPPVTGGLTGYLNTNHFASDNQDFLTLASTNLVPNLVGLSPVTNPRANRTFGGVSGTASATGSTFTFITFSDTAGEILYGNSSGTEDSDIWIIGYIDQLVV